MKKILFTMIIVFVVNTISADIKKDNEIVISKKTITTDICSITYTVKERIGNHVISTDYTFTATTCEEVEKAAISAGIIKSKAITVE